jgi:hypothetical protein
VPLKGRASPARHPISLFSYGPRCAKTSDHILAGNTVQVPRMWEMSRTVGTEESYWGGFVLSSNIGV